MVLLATAFATPTLWPYTPFYHLAGTTCGAFGYLEHPEADYGTSDWYISVSGSHDGKGGYTATEAWMHVYGTTLLERAWTCEGGSVYLDQESWANTSSDGWESQEATTYLEPLLVWSAGTSPGDSWSYAAEAVEAGWTRRSHGGVEGSVRRLSASGRFRYLWNALYPSVNGPIHGAVLAVDQWGETEILRGAQYVVVVRGIGIWRYMYADGSYEQVGYFP